MWCWMNGQFIKQEDLTISPLDHGFLYGLGFFETFRTYHNHVFLWEEHCARLQQALDEYRITLPYSYEELLHAICELNERMGGEDGYFRLNVSAGVHDVGLQPTSYNTPNVILFRKALPPMTRGAEKEAKWLNTKRNTPEQSVRYKSHHYANNVRARLELPSLAQYEGFFVTEEGFVAEGITSNIFWVQNRIIYTPSLETGILPGVTRSWVIRAAKELGLKVVEGLFRAGELEASEECFVTTSVQELVPISSVDQTNYLGHKGPVYQTLHRHYQQEVDALRERE